MKKTTKMMSTDPAERQAAMAARIHRLSDPLTAMDQRSHYDRLHAEARARKLLLVITLTAMLAFTGAIAVVNPPGASVDAGIAYEQTSNQPVHIRTKSS